MEYVERAAKWAGVQLAAGMRERLADYQGWLWREGIAGGGLGPNEEADLSRRHLADSLLFAIGWREGRVPHRVADIGSGAGLPGIPLAITHLSTHFTLVERSGSRCRLLRRAVRILELENVEVLEGEASSLTGRWPAVVARAVAPPESLRGMMESLLLAGGIGVVGGSHVHRVSAVGFSTVVVPREILDREVSLLIMAVP